MIARPGLETSRAEVPGRMDAGEMEARLAAPANARILVVEDEILVSVLIGSILDDLGCDMVGPAGSVAAALALARTEPLAGALLDVNVGGESIYPAADALAARGIPFVFITGYKRADLAPPHHDAPALEKPFDETMLATAVRTVFGVRNSL